MLLDTRFLPSSSGDIFTDKVELERTNHMLCHSVFCPPAPCPSASWLPANGGICKTSPSTPLFALQTVELGSRPITGTVAANLVKLYWTGLAVTTLSPHLNYKPKTVVQWPSPPKHTHKIPSGSPHIGLDGESMVVNTRHKNLVQRQFCSCVFIITAVVTCEYPKRSL